MQMHLKLLNLLLCSAVAFPDVPFYIYDGPAVRRLRKACSPFRNYKYIHGKVEPTFLDALDAHPWRTTDPKEALLFVMPLYSTPMVRIQCAIRRIHKNFGLYTYMAREIESTPMYQRYQGRDHLMMGHDYQSGRVGKVSTRLKRVTRNFIFGFYGASVAETYWRCSVITPYFPTVTKLRPKRAQARYDNLTYEEWLQRPYNLIFQGATKHARSAFETRRTAVKKLPGYFSPAVLVSTTDPNKYPLCHQFPENETLLEGCYEPMIRKRSHDSFVTRVFNSRFGLHLRGDDATSARLYDLLAAGVVVFMVPTEAWRKALPFQCDVPWRDLVRFVDEKAFLADPPGTVQRAMRQSGEAWVRKTLRVMGEHAGDLLWGMDPTRVSENVLRQAVRKCLPDVVLREKGRAREEWPCTNGDLSLSI